MTRHKKCIKGFDSNLKCRDFQYEIGKEYKLPEDENIKICEKGFHAIDEDECPLSVFEFYPPAIDGKQSRYCEVEVDGDTDKKGGKIVGSEIKIGAEIGIPGLVKAHVDWVKRHLIDDEEHKSTNTGDYSSASNTGYCSSASVTGKDSVAIAVGYGSKAKGPLGCAIVVAERGGWNGETYPLKAICSAIVDGEKIKADTWYTVKDGKFIETE